MYQRLQTSNITVSHSSVIQLLDKIGKDYDTVVKEWRESLMSTLDSTNEIVRIEL